MEKHFDYIIAGAGCAGLSLAFKMIHDSFFDSKSILLIDIDKKNINDRTWCHWSKEASIFDPVVKKSWSKLIFASSSTYLKRNINPYQYKIIKGIDFYEHTLTALNKAKNVSIQFEKIEDIKEDKENVSIKTSENTYRGEHLFKSFSQIPDDHNDHLVLQHFKGWFVKTAQDYFDEETIHFMDFRIPQKNETRFFYVLPTSKTEALIEVAIFSKQVLSSKEYDEIQKDYLAEHFSDLEFTLLEEEIGVIPMTTYDFAQFDTDRITNIGTAGGAVKPSSGYAFERIQDHTDSIISLLKKGNHPGKAQAIFKSKYKLFDKIFMNVLLSDKASGERVFSDMFKKLKPQHIFKFLDEDTSFLEELRIFTAPPTLPFVKAFFEEIKS